MTTTRATGDRAFLYARLSHRKDDKLASCDVQLDTLRNEAQRRRLHVVGEFTDDGHSAWADDGLKHRPDYAEMLDRMENGETDYVLAVDTDRFSRGDMGGAISLDVSGAAA